MNILFWSGGKDSYLAWHFFCESQPDADIKLLTTYNKTNDTVPHQNIPLNEIKEQANHLNLELIAVGLPPDCPNKIYLKEIEKTLADVDETIQNLVFGDWYLEDIREWRKEVFGDMGYSCLFPIWEKSIHDLLPILLLAPMEIKITAVEEEYQSLIKVGESFDQALVTQLQRLNDIDPMGEQGEFHTKVIFNDPSKSQKQPLTPRHR